MSTGLKILVSSPAALFQRFQQPADVAPPDGWPEPSKEWKAAEAGRKKRAREHLEAEARRDRAEARAAELEANGPPSVEAIKQRLAENSAARKKKLARQN